MKKRSAGRTLFTLGESYWIIYHAMRSMPAIARARKRGLLDKHFSERLVLAVTEVNHCAMCSYAHTKIALRAGMEQAEISAMLSGDLSGVMPEELTAILFAQHYADCRNKPDREAWQTVLAQYGPEKSDALLGVIRMITMGNAYGIPSGSLLARVSRRRAPDERSSLGYELAMLLTMIVFLPCAALHALAAATLRAPAIRL
ncbi:MAG: carboxymuconolactone decarboxylase family protein [Eubacteriales bacterium]|nr:carboxymuconolactone decarboxylase family protein [Eubacteriales bacterium]